MSLADGRTWTPPLSNDKGFIRISFDYTALGRRGIHTGALPQEMQRIINIVLSRASNRAAEAFKTVALRETAEKYYVKQKDIRASVTLKRAYGAHNMGATIISRGTRRILADYIQLPKVNPGRKIDPYKFAGAVKRAGGLKKFRTAFFLHKNSHTVYIRSDGGNIERVTSPSIPQLMKNETTVFKAEKKAREVFLKRLDYELAHEWGIK